MSDTKGTVREREDEVDDGVPRPKKFKGRRVSGRVWKTDVREPINKAVKDKAAHKSWSQKEELRHELKRVRDLERARKEAMEESFNRKKEAAEERKKRRIINERNSQITQPLNSKKLKQKLKTMSKKQLRQIRKEGVAPLLKE